MLHKAHVELDQVKADLLQNVQRGIAAAEVVHPDPEAQFLKALNLLPDEFKVAADRAFGNLDGQHRAVNSGCIDALPDLLHDVAAVKIRTGKIHGLRHRIQTGLCLLFQLLQHALDHIEIQLIDQPGFLQRGDKVGRRQEASHRVDPARQCFLVTDLPVGGAYDCLIIDRDPALCQCPVQVFDDVLLLHGILQHLLVEIPKAGFLCAAVQITGDFCPVADCPDLDAVFRYAINARTDRQCFSFIQQRTCFKQFFQPLSDALFLRQDGKMVLPETGTVLIAEVAGQQIPESPDQLIPFRKAPLVVEGLHPAEVQEENDRLFPAHPYASDAVLRKFEEIGHVGQSGQRVIADLARHAAFPQHLVERAVQTAGAFPFFLFIIPLNGIPHVGQSYACLGIYMPALSMNHGNPAVVFRPGTVDDVIFPALGGKAEGSVGNTAHIVRMGRAVHVIIHDEISLFPVFKAEQVQKAFGQDERINPSVDELIDRKRNR